MRSILPDVFLAPPSAVARVCAALVTVAVLLSLPEPGCGQEPRAPALGTLGLPGLVVTPTVGALPVGRFYGGVNTFPDFGSFWARPDYTLGRQVNGFLAFNLFSRVTVSARVSDLHPRERQPIIWVRGPGGRLQVEVHGADLSPGVQVLLAREGAWLPGFAAGAYDVTGTGELAARYLVASRSLGETLRLSAGFGFGPHVLDGWFGGAELRPAEWASLRGEWDGQRFNAGLGLRPGSAGLLGGWVSNPEIQAYWAEGKGWYWGASLGLPWDGDAPGGPSPSAGAARSAGTSAPAWRTASELLGRLSDLGLENLGAVVSDSVVRVRYEDRVHLQNALDGLTRVMRVLAQGVSTDPAPAEIDVLSSERPVLRVSLTSSALRALRDGAAFASVRDGIRFTYPMAEPADGPTWTNAGREASARGRADLVLRPTVSTHLAWERALADARFGLLPTVELPLFAGLSAAVGYDLSLWQSEGMVVSKGPLPGGSVGIASLSYVWNRSLTPASALAVHWSGGRLNGFRDGVRQQAALFLRGGALRLDADVAATRAVGGTSRSILAVGGARWLFPDGDTRLSLSAGHFLYRDVGIIAELSRYFGDTQVAFSVRHSDHGSLGVFSVTLPLLGERSRRPGRIRPRLPSEWFHGQGSTLFTGSGNWIASNIAEGIRSPAEGWSRFSDRDRLSPFAAARGLGAGRFLGWD